MWRIFTLPGSFIILRINVVPGWRTIMRARKIKGRRV
jgi:hypothetical protein